MTTIVVPELIVGELVTLLPATSDQALAVLEGVEPHGIRLAAGFPHPDTADGLRMALAHKVPPGWWVVADRRVVGDCGVHGPISETGEVEIGYGLAEPWRGLGLGRETVRLLTRWLVALDDVHTVAARVAPANTPSRRALESCAFVVTARTDDQVTYSYVAD
jgi:RimJ/RimL family protein N-acetyltransferase